MSRLFSSEAVSKWHPDKYADQISDAILTECLRQDKNSHVACETLVKNHTVVLAGEITTKADIDYEAIVHRVADNLGYQVDEVINLLTKQSPEIDRAVDKESSIGAGDQGMMYGYAVKGQDYLPYGFLLANKFIKALEAATEKDHILKGDAKVQVTVDLPETGSLGTANPMSVKTVLVSVCYNEDHALEFIEGYVHKILSNVDCKVIDYCNLIVNPSGMWTLGGPDADCGLTGRKIVCDQYGGYAPVGGGAFSGKDPTKVDRSGAYMARKIACAVVDEFDVDSCEIQLAYGIGLSEPLSVNVKTSVPELDNYISKWISEKYDLTPKGMIEYLHLLDLDYYDIAKGCHMVHFN